MDGASFPPEVRAFAALEKRLETEDLSLQDIEEISQQVMGQTTDKTRSIGCNLLNRCEEKKDKLVARQVTLLEQTQGPIAKIKQLKPLIFFLPPDEVERQFDVIEMQTSLLQGKDLRVQESVQKQLGHMRFKEDKPLLHDLDDETPNNFVSQSRKVADLVLKSGSLEPMREHFNTRQLQEIFRPMGGL